MSSTSRRTKQSILCWRAGFTASDLTILLVVIAVLIALLLPAIQAAREAARRVHCSNNLKQQMIALLNYHDVYRCYAAGYLYRGGNGKQNYGWAVASLPFLEQLSYYEVLKPDKVPLFKRWERANAEDQQLLQIQLEVFRCPTDLGPKLADSIGFGQPDPAKDPFHVSLGNYAGVAGWDDQVVRDEECSGIFYGNSFVPLRDVKDGTSNTLALVERSYWQPDSESTYQHAATWIGVGRNDQDANYGTLRTLALMTFGINVDHETLNNKPEDMGKGAASMHPGGVNAALCDGSVRFLADLIDTEVLKAFSQRNDGHLVPLP